MGPRTEQSGLKLGIIITLWGLGEDKVGQNRILSLHYGAKDRTRWVKTGHYYHYTMGPKTEQGGQSKLLPLNYVAKERGDKEVLFF